MIHQLIQREKTTRKQLYSQWVVVEDEPFLARFKEKPLAKFKQKVFEVVDNGRFKCMF